MNSKFDDNGNMIHCRYGEDNIMSNETEIEKNRKEFLEKLQEAEKAAYDYACACDLGDERVQAFEFYERIRNVTRL